MLKANSLHQKEKQPILFPYPIMWNYQMENGKIIGHDRATASCTPQLLSATQVSISNHLKKNFEIFFYFILFLWCLQEDKQYNPKLQRNKKKNYFYILL